MHSVWFLRASAMLKHVITIGLTSVCPSVRPSVRLSVRHTLRRWHPIKTAEYIVMLSSPRDSPFILVLCISRCSRNSDGVTPCGSAKYRWGIKFASCCLPQDVQSATGGRQRHVGSQQTCLSVCLIMPRRRRSDFLEG